MYIISYNEISPRLFFLLLSTSLSSMSTTSSLSTLESSSSTLSLLSSPPPPSCLIPDSKNQKIIKFSSLKCPVPVKIQCTIPENHLFQTGLKKAIVILMCYSSKRGRLTCRNMSCSFLFVHLEACVHDI